MKGTPGNKVDQQAIEDQILAHLGENDIVTLSGAQAQFDIRLEQLPPETLDLANILTQIEKPVQNAQFDKAQKIFKQDSVGVSFDADEAQKTFDAMDWGEKRSLPLTITQPTVTVADLSGQLYQDTLGSCTTNIAGTVNRVENIKLAAKFFNGAVIMPGEEFSYNGLVGSRRPPAAFCPPPLTSAARAFRRRAAVCVRALPPSIWRRCGPTCRSPSAIPTGISPAMFRKGWTPRSTTAQRTLSLRTTRPSR